MCCAWRGACVPLDGTIGVVALVTSTTAYCLTAETGLAVALHGDVSRTRSGAAVCVPGLVVSPNWVGAPVTFDCGVLVIGSFATIDLRSGLVFDSAQSLRASRRVWPSLGDVAATVGVEALSGAEARLGSRIDAVLHSLVVGDEASVQLAVGRLIGFGPGLTPSGDDALVSMLAAFRQQRWTGAEGLRTAVEQSRRHTGFVSATMLNLAVSGHFDEAITDVLTADDELTATRAVRRLLRTGASSGADMLFGLLAGLRFAAAHCMIGVAA